MDHRQDFTTDKVVLSYHKAKLHELENLEVDYIVDLLKRRQDWKGFATCEGLLVDVGCGNGGVTRRLAKYFDRVIGVDVSLEQVKKAREADHPENVEFRVGQAEDLPISDKSVDFITAVFSLHFTELEKFVKECKRILKPRGVALFYGDVLSNVTSITNNMAPDTTSHIYDMYNKYSQIATATSHPESHLIDRYSTIFDLIDWPNKRIVGADLADIVLSLGDLKDHLMSVPFYGRAGTTCDNPLVDFTDTVKRIWSMQEIDEKEIMIRVSNRAFAIILS